MSDNMRQPVCGYCGHDLTGLEVNRCPMCRLLLIDAGVSIRMTAEGRAKQLRRIFLLVGFIILSGLSMFGMTHLESRSRADADAAKRELNSIQAELAFLGRQHGDGAWSIVNNPHATKLNDGIFRATNDSKYYSALVRRIGELQLLP